MHTPEMQFTVKELTMTQDKKRILQALVEGGRASMRITRIEASHTLMSSRGNYTLGLQAVYSGGDGPDEGYTVEDARIAEVLLGLEATLGAIRNAFSDGAINEEHYNARVARSKANALAHIDRLRDPAATPQSMKEAS